MEMAGVIDALPDSLHLKLLVSERFHLESGGEAFTLAGEGRAGQGYILLKRDNCPHVNEVWWCCGLRWSSRGGGREIFRRETVEPKHGKAKVTKQVIDEIDEKTVIFRTIEGDLLELYKNFVLTLHVDTKGANSLVTWTMEYEKRSEDIDDPNTLMDFFVNLTKDIETHHLK
ncbi:hypothetical protein RJ640_002355 [Escallonia rubra]|uniref:Bet v I/Major latex protein domain-containing protein n=1 Tax=Escallonia rubra TaxID=112253 RepID=A0AA88QEH8_9ASTE|nr:hypothetical protein RJ640_002355 [Escallonia rubra]